MAVKGTVKDNTSSQYPGNVNPWDTDSNKWRHVCNIIVSNAQAGATINEQ